MEIYTGAFPGSGRFWCPENTPLSLQWLLVCTGFSLNSREQVPVIYVLSTSFVICATLAPLNIRVYR